MNLRLIVSFLISNYFLKSSSFNIATSSSTLTPLPPEDSDLEKNPNNPNFYGYDMSIRNSKPTPSNPDGSFDLFIGAPKTVNPDDPDLQLGPPTPSTQGQIRKCSFSFEYEDDIPICDPVTPPPDSGPGDAYGLAVNFPKDGDEPKLVACSPTKQQDCGPKNNTNFNAPGFCYRSPNLGLDWEPDPRTADLTCDDFELDLIFIIDGSSSVGSDFSKIIDWIKQVAANFVISNGSTKIGVIQFSSYLAFLPLNKQPYVLNEIPLGKYKSQDKLAKALSEIALQGYATDTAAALDLTALDFKNSTRFNWANTSKVAVLLTDGRATDADKLPESANYLRSLNVTTFAIGVGNYSLPELRTIASGDNTSNENVYNIDNYDGLKGITKNLKQAITTFALEGSSSQSDDVVKYEMQLAEYGFSLQPSKLTSPQRSGGLYLGAVGAYDWSGTIVKYDSANDQEPDIPDFDQVKTVLKNWTKESYLGYALSSGFYNGGTTNEYVAIGAPRHRLEGAVVVYKPKVANASFTDASTIYPASSIKQLGSYYGGVLLSLDVNGDSMDDLLVGAPLYIGSQYDDGRVFVYLTKSGTDNPKAWASPSYTPQVLSSGSSSGGGRFGTAIASAGDINDDGFNDVIIGAPYANGNKGAVYVFHGSATGINPKPQQTIEAASLPNPNLMYFGLSIQGGQDLDGNGYPDVVVGAPKSDAVLIFRTRPVVKFKGSLSFDKSSVDIFQCLKLPDRNCLSLRACLEMDGKSVEPTIEVDYQVNLDTLIPGRDNKRVEFRIGNSSSAQPSFSDSGSRTLKKAVQDCWTYTVYVKRGITDYSTIVESTMTYELAKSHTSQPLSSVRDPSISNEFTANTSFARNCGADRKCLYNLGISANVIIPQSSLTVGGKTVDLTEEGKILIISSQTSTHPVTVKVNLTNTGENAFDVRVKITYNYALSWTNLGTLQSSNPASTQACVVESPQGDTSSGEISRSKLLKYSSGNLGGIMQENQWCYFEFNLSSNALKDSGSIPSMNIAIDTFTVSTGNSNDTDPNNNKWTSETPIRYRADAQTTDRTSEITVPFNFTSGNETIESVRQIGRNTSDIQMVYEVRGEGHSNIPESTITLRYPYNLPRSDSQHLLYLYKYSCVSNEGQSGCVCDSSNVNPYKLLNGFPTVNDTNLPNVTVLANPNVINQSETFDCSIGSNQSEGVCATFRCNISGLSEGDSVVFTASFRLWSQSLNLNGDSIVILRSGFQYSTADSPLIINKDGKNATTYTSTTNTEARLYKSPPQIVKTDILWIYIVAAIGGLLLLIIIIIILWKTGFFKSKYAEKKEALEWTEANGGDAGSTANMMN